MDWIFEYLKNHCLDIIKAIATCNDDRYSSLISDNNNESSGISDDENMEIKDDDSALFYVCCVLNTKVWHKLQEGSKDDENLLLQLNSVKNLFEKFNNMKVFHSVGINSLIGGYSECSIRIQLLRHWTYWANESMEKALDNGKNNEYWKDIMLLLELCLCSPFSNATLEIFFSCLKVVKTQLRSKLSTES